MLCNSRKAYILPILRREPRSLLTVVRLGGETGIPVPQNPSHTFPAKSETWSCRIRVLPHAASGPNPHAYLRGLITIQRIDIDQRPCSNKRLKFSSISVGIPSCGIISDGTAHC